MTKFEKACEMSLNDWSNHFPDIMPKAEYTKRHEKWLKNLYNKMRDNKYHIFTTKTVRLIMVAAVITTLLFTAFAIPSSREYIIEKFDVFGVYKITEPNNNSVNGKISVGYLPDGCKLESENFQSKNSIQYYSLPSGGTLMIIKYSSSIKVDYNTETVESEAIVIDNTTYMYSLSENNFGDVIWTENDYIYQINGELSKEELIKIAVTVD